MNFSPKLFLSLCLLSIALPARAHLPSASSADFHWEHDRLEARATFSLAMANALLGTPDVTLTDSAGFAANNDRLIARFAEAFTVEAAGQPVRPVRVTAELTADGDAAATLVYPPMPKTALTVHARFLERVSPGSYCTLRIWDGADALLAHKLLLRTAPRASAAAPPARDAPP